MTITMNDKQINTFKQIENFLDGTTSCDFVSNSKEETYKWITDVLIKFSYYKLEKSKKSLVRNYLKKVTGYSHSQLTRLIKSQKQVGKVVKKRYLRNVFSRKYLAKEIVLLAQTDELHDNPNGKTIKRILEREWQIFKKDEFKNLSKISASHIYNLRSTVVYKRVNKTYEKTKSVESLIGERRKPQPNGKPGYLRVDSVHQGKKDNKAGVYHINIVDEVTQFDFVGAVETISENHMIPMLEQLIDIYPFIIFEIHADNGSEYINKFVANMLNKLVIELTKNRPRHCNDNALVESKNASVIKKWIGYSFMLKEYAKKLNLLFPVCSASG